MHMHVSIYGYLCERFIKMFNEIAMVVSSCTQRFAGLILLMLKAIGIRTVE